MVIVTIFKMLTADFANCILKSYLYSEDAEMKPAQNVKSDNFEDADCRFCKLNFKDTHLYSEDAEMKPAQNGNIPILKMPTADFAN